MNKEPVEEARHIWAPNIHCRLGFDGTLIKVHIKKHVYDIEEPEGHFRHVLSHDMSIVLFLALDLAMKYRLKHILLPWAENCFS